MLSIGNAYLQGLESQYPVLPQQTNSTFIIVSQSPVKDFFLLHFKKCTRGANHRLPIPQIKYLCGFMITAFYPAMANEKYLNHKMSPFHFGRRKTDVLRTSCALSRKAPKCPVLRLFADYSYFLVFPSEFYTFSKMRQNKANHFPHS